MTDEPEEQRKAEPVAPAAAALTPTATPPGPLDDATPAVVGSAISVGIALLVLIGLATRFGAAPTGCYPEPADVIIGITAAAGACFGMTFSAYVARRTRNWFHGITAAGCFVFLAGLVGQRSFAGTQTADMAQWCASANPVNWWAAHLQLPVLGLGISPMELTGLIIAVVGICLVLVFERVGSAAEAVAVTAGSLDDADTV